MKRGRLPEAVAGRYFHYFRGWLDKCGSLGTGLGIADGFYPSGKARCAAETDLKLKDRVRACDRGSRTDGDSSAAISLEGCAQYKDTWK
ncbi:MAG: hypothetical protein LBU32_15205 [Clostridiales bacterium]|nr:hypothetical protein [Clostridiales bacterium]